MKLLRTCAAVVCVVTGLSSCAERPAETRPALYASRIPGLGLESRDDVDAADLAVSPEGDLHVVWRAVLRPPDGTTNPSYPVRYVRGEAGGKSWGRPVEVDALGDPPRVAVTPDAVHVLFGPKLRHFAGDGRGAFRELAPLLAPGRHRALAFDLLSAGGEVLVAYLLEIPAAGVSRGGLELHVAAAGRADRTVARFPASVLQQAAPRLSADGGKLFLLCAVNLEEGNEAEGVAAAGKLVFLQSADGGATWTEPAEVVPGRRLPAVQAVALLPHQGALYAFCSALGLWASRSIDGRVWSPPAHVAPYTTSLAQGSEESGSVAAVTGPHGVVVAWIDARFRKSDRRWWNPLGGLPWSDADPLWANNDVFAVDLAAVDRALAGHPAVPRRLTPPLSFARGLRAAALDGGVVLLWAGRSAVGRQLESSGEPPELFYAAF